MENSKLPVSALELKIRSLIADKEFLTASANFDLHRGGWRLDYEGWRRVIQNEIDELFKLIEEEKKLNEN